MKDFDFAKADSEIYGRMYEHQKQEAHPKKQKEKSVYVDGTKLRTFKPATLELLRKPNFWNNFKYIMNESCWSKRMRIPENDGNNDYIVYLLTYNPSSESFKPIRMPSYGELKGIPFEVGIIRKGEEIPPSTLHKKYVIKHVKTGLTQKKAMILQAKLLYFFGNNRSQRGGLIVPRDKTYTIRSPHSCTSEFLTV